MTRPTLFAALAALAVLALPLAAAQHGPPPGQTDPVAYAQDYAGKQAAQASADPAGYAAGKATPDGVAGEAEHAAWLACWTAHEAGLPLEPACASFFTPPVAVDAPAGAEAEVAEALNGTDALASEVLDAAGDAVQDPASALDQAQRIAGAAVAFVLGLVDGVLDLLGLGGAVALDGLLALVDGLVALAGLPALGLRTALDGLGLGLGAAADGLAAAGSGLAAGAQAALDGLASAASATADAAASGLGALAGGASAAVDAAGEAADAVAGAVSDAAEAVRDAVSGWFGGDGAAGPSGDGGALDGGVEAGTPADGLVDRVLGLL